MWATLTPEILARFPRHPLNGAINGVHASSGTTPQGDWDARIAELDVFRTYTDDWDGQGAAGLAAPAAAIGGELVDSAVTLARSLQNQGVLAPDAVCPGVEGTVCLEWDLSGGGSASLEVKEPGKAELFVFTPGNPGVLTLLTDAVTASPAEGRT